MSAIATASIVFFCIFCGALIGMFLRSVLPQHHLKEESRDTVKMGAGIIATLSALVLGLLVGSAKSSFDTLNSGLMEAGARIVLLDRVLAHYGPETEKIREQLRNAVAYTLERNWPGTGPGTAAVNVEEGKRGLEEMLEGLLDLSPHNDAQRWLKSQAIEMTSEQARSRMLLIEQSQAELPPAFLGILVFWLVITFFIFGLFAPRNATVFVALLVCAMSMAGAILLILELNQPLQGMIQVSSAPLRNAYKTLEASHGR